MLLEVGGELYSLHTQVILNNDKIILRTSGLRVSAGTMSGSHLSKDFFELVKAIGESKSKQEEDRIIMNEVGDSYE